METNWRVLLALFYPITVVVMAAGFIAFFMALLKQSPLFIGTVVIWLFFVSTTSIYVISKEAVRALGFRNIYLGIVITFGILAVLSLALLLLEFRW